MYQVVCWICVFISLQYVYLGVEMLDHMVTGF